MPKRFTDTALSRKAWFRKLSPAFKSAWRFLTDECDNAGAWSIDLEAMEFYVGSPIDLDAFLAAINLDETRIVRLGSDKLFFPGFIPFQYGELSKECKPHKSIIQRLKDLDLLDAHSKGYPKGFETLQEKKRQEKEWNRKGKGKEEQNPSEWNNATTLEDCIRNAIFDGDEEKLESLLSNLPPAKQDTYRKIWVEQCLKNAGVA